MLLTKAVDKLLAVSSLIELRTAFKTTEETRVHEAFALLARESHHPGSTTSKNKRVYVEFLQRVQSILGVPEVALSAAALGSTGVAALREPDRVKLPHEMKKHKTQLRGAALVRLAQLCCAKCIVLRSKISRN